MQDEEGWLGDVYVKILSARRGWDRWEMDSVIVTCEWTNNSDSECSFSEALRCHVYQGGYQGDDGNYQGGIWLMNTLGKDDTDDMLDMKISPGETQVVQCIYEMRDVEGPIYVKCSKPGWHDTVVRTFEALE